MLGSNNWLVIIVIGFVVGLLARFLKPGNDRMGLILTTLLGIAGALLAGWIGQQMGWYAPGQPAGFVGALLGDKADIGCNSVLNPGTIIERGTMMYPLTNWRGVVGPNRIVKNKAAVQVVERRVN